MLDKFKKAFVLLVIGAFSGFTIWGVNELTFQKIADNQQLKEEGFYKDIFELDSDIEIEFSKAEAGDLEEVTVTLKSDGSLVGYIYKGSEKNNYGSISVLVGISNDTVSNVIISTSTNTPNFVKKIEKNNLTPFMGQDTTDVTYDTKTGASYTYGSVSNIVTQAVEYYNTERGAN